MIGHDIYMYIFYDIHSLMRMMIKPFHGYIKSTAVTNFNIELVSKYMYTRFSHLVRVNVYVKRSLDPVVQLLCWHQRHAAATTTHASETVQVH